MSVIDVVTISSPGSGSIAATATCTAAVPDAQATARVPSISAKRVSSAETWVPLVLVSVPLAIASRRSTSSSSPSVRPDASWSDGSTSASGRRKSVMRLLVSSQVRLLSEPEFPASPTPLDPHHPNGHRG